MRNKIILIFFVALLALSILPTVFADPWTIERQINHNYNDGTYEVRYLAPAQPIEWYYNYHGGWAGIYWHEYHTAAWRFTNIQIPQGAEIIDA